MKKRFQKLRRRAFKAARISTILGVALLLAAWVAVEFYVWTTPLPGSLANEYKLDGTPVYIARDGTIISEKNTETARVHIPISYEEMGRWLPLVTVQLEDHRYYDHSGVDFIGIGSAAARNAKNLKLVSGGSTISQQLIKLADGRLGRSASSKFREMALALKLEREEKWTKERILTEYINRLEYGNRLIGPEAAARAYFGKSCRDLTLAEATLLAGIPNAPTAFNPWRRKQASLAKYRRSIRRLEVLEHVTPDEADRLCKSPPRVMEIRPARQAGMFMNALERKHGIANGVQRTTIDLELQERAQMILRSGLAAVARHDVRNAAMVVIENESGAVRALVTASDGTHEGSEINCALTKRHAGSTLKPFVYLQAIDEGKLTAAHLLADTPDAIRRIYPDYDPHNYSRKSYGPVRVRQALASSLNVPAVLVAHEVGERRAFQQLQKFGIAPDAVFENSGAGFVLGNLRVSLLELTNAYRALARGGVASDFHFTEVAAENPDLFLVENTKAASIIEDILCDDNARALAFGTGSALHPGYRAAVKTGTSSSIRDSWTVGYNRDYTVGVWVGNVTGQPMEGMTTLASASPMWNRMMRHLRHTAQARPLIKPESRSTTEICSTTGFRAGSRSPKTQQEYFLPGTEPTRTADVWFHADGHLLLPDTYAAWCRSKHNHLGAEVKAASTFEILVPARGATYLIDEDLPPSQQFLTFQAIAADSNEITWRINGQETPDNWQLQRGRHELTAVLDDESHASVEFLVE